MIHDFGKSQPRAATRRAQRLGCGRKQSHRAARGVPEVAELRDGGLRGVKTSDSETEKHGGRQRQGHGAELAPGLAIEAGITRDPGAAHALESQPGVRVVYWERAAHLRAGACVGARLEE